MTDLNFTDATTIAGTRVTADGYLVAEVRCARTGCQTYHATELGLIGDDLINVYRPETAVFDKASMATFSGKPVTMGHPPEQVTADNWRKYAVGDIGEEIARDGETIRVPITLMDAAAVKAVQDGTREISMGYTTPLHMEDGVAPDGTEYQAVQTGPIKINHLAIVPRARGGQELRVGDGAKEWGAAPITPSSKKEVTMTDALKTVVLGDKAVNVTAADVATIDKFKADTAKALADAETASAENIKAKQAEIDKLKAELDDMKGKMPTKDGMAKLVADRVALEGTAAKIAPDVKASGLTDGDLKKAVVVAKLGDEAVADKSEAYIDARFDILAEDAGKTADPMNKPMSAQALSDAAVHDKAWSDNVTHMSEAWKHGPLGKKEA